MWAAILAFLSNLFGAIPEIIKYFKKSPTEKVEKSKKEIDAIEEEGKKGGRPR